MNWTLRIGIIGMVLSAVVALLPIGAVLVSEIISTAAGCTVNEAYADPCIVAGVDIADLLYTLFVSGWLALISLPFGGAGVMVFGIVSLVGAFTHKRS
jgi:hypothetical protein